jgi:hypothetical protein
MAFPSHHVQNPKACRGAPEILEDERTDCGGPRKCKVIKEQTER